MFTFVPFLTLLQAAIAVASERDRSMPMFFIGLWNRVGRMRRRLEKLIALWRAGMLPKARERASRAGQANAGGAQTFRAPTNHGWLWPRMPQAGQYAAMLANMLTDEECARFVAEVPAARKIVNALERMLLPTPGKPAPTMKREQVWPPAAWQAAVRQAGMHVGPTGRLEWN